MKIFKLSTLHKYKILLNFKEVGTMNVITIIIWITIAIIAIISIIAVKLHYKGEELETEEGSILDDIKSIAKKPSSPKNQLSNETSKTNHSSQLNEYNHNDFETIIPAHDEVDEEPAIIEIENENENTYRNVEYSSPNQVLVNYNQTVEKFQEPINENQMSIMNQNNAQEDKTELKDLFTIDELIKESKRKDNERKQEPVSEEEEKEINELKESIKQKQENKTEDALIEEIIENEEDTVLEIINDTKEETAGEKEETINDLINEDAVEEKEETINDLINETAEDAVEEEKEIEAPIVTSQDIEEAITTASQESKEETESISETSDITDAILDSANEVPEEEIKEPILKTPTKVDESKKDYKFGADLDDDDVFGEYENDLDYRKDIAKITNTIKGSKIFQDVKEKLIPDEEEDETHPIEEEFIRNVNEYEDDFAPIINETHADYEATYEDLHARDFEEDIRQKNTQNVFNVKTSPEPQKPAPEPKIRPIKEKPSRENIKIQINNADYVLKKGDEIIFTHQGETYSSQVYAIHGDDISVKYRRKNITIKPSDVKKVY